MPIEFARACGNCSACDMAEEERARGSNRHGDNPSAMACECHPRWRLSTDPLGLASAAGKVRTRDSRAAGSSLAESRGGGAAGKVLLDLAFLLTVDYVLPSAGQRQELVFQVGRCPIPSHSRVLGRFP